MFPLSLKKYLTFLITLNLVIFLFTNSTFSQEYLDKVIKRLNTVETELKNIKDFKGKEPRPAPDLNNSIAIHEQRIVDIEEEIRNLNGYLDDINFKLDNLTSSLDDIKKLVKKTTFSNENEYNQIETDEKEENADYFSDNKQPVILADPNKENNPEMKILGTIKKEVINDDVVKEKNNTFKIEEKNKNASEELKKLAENPSDIYKYAYNMLVQENYKEAENSFKTFIGEHPKDPLASNAYYWLGETYYVQKKFQLAAISFARGYKSFPKGNKAIDQLFKLALTFINLGKNEDACASFSKLELEFPNSPKRISNRAKEYKKRAKCQA